MVDVVISVVAKVAELLVVPIGKHICYPFKYKSNMEELKKQVKKLTNAKERVQHSVDEATRQGEEIEKDVEQWLNSVDEFAEKVVKLIIDNEDKAGKLCSIGFFPNLMTRYSLSKKAAKTAKNGVNLLGEGKFEKVSYNLLLQKTTSIYTRGYDDFASRKPIVNDLMQALTEADVNFIGVYGMGGVGKTTLVKRVIGQAIEDKLFDVVVMVEVTETPEIKNIQGQIADELGLKFHEDSLTVRATRLRDRLKKEKRVLIVLDNIWAQLDLDAVGIPCGGEEKRNVTQEAEQDGASDNKRLCKILLTSRNLDVLHDDMNTQKEFLVEILSEEEAGNLFWKIAGHSKEKVDVESVAVEIVKKCGGLPVAIATIASALKNKSLYVWKNALEQLRTSNPRNIKGMDANVYSTIKLSYDFLESEEAKSLFLLCAVVSASGSNFIMDVLKYATGWGLFPDVYTMEKRRDMLQTLIDTLKASCLLLDYDRINRIKMHNIIHAVAVSIASTNKLMFNIQTGLKAMLEEKLPKDATVASLPYGDIFELPERLELPKLKLLFLFKKDLNLLPISDTFFEGAKQLKVLDLTRFHFLSLPSSLQLLINLQTLCLDCCVLGDISTVGALGKLEVLSLVSSDIEHLPGEIRQLTRLRLLDLSKCSKLKTVTPGVISSLTRLEELYMGSFVQWDIDGRTNASLAELKELSQLTRLKIHVLDAQIMSEDLLIFEKLEKYRILIGDVWEWSDDYEASRTLKLKLSNRNFLGNGIKTLLNRTEDLYLDELKGVKNVLYQLDEEGFPQLKHLHVQNGPKIQYIINSAGSGTLNFFRKLESLFLHNLINLEKMCHGQLATESFSKLRIIRVGKCDRLKHLFSFSAANNLLQIQEIEVSNCKKLEEIIFMERNSGIEFSQLRTLTLECLPQLTSFRFNAFTPDIGSHEILAEDELGGFMPSFGQNVLLPCLENLKLSSINIECMWLDQLPAMSSCCQTLTSLILEECSGTLKFLFSYSMVKSLVRLQKLEIRNCKSIEGIINTEELIGEGILLVFPNLIKVQLKGLPNLRQFGSGNSVEFPSMTQLSIEDCPKLKTFSSTFKSVDIMQSKEVEMNCQEDHIHLLFDQMVVLPTLASLNMSSIGIETIWHNQFQPMSSCFQNLTNIIMDGCDTVKYAFSSSMVESLIQLKVLEISNCKFMEVVTITAGERINSPLFPKLYRLHVKHLPKLTSFCKFAGSSFELPSLARLWIDNCPKMLTFVSNYPHSDMPASMEEYMNAEENLHSHIQPFFDEKVQLPDLKFLRIDKMDNMRQIWHYQLAPNSFSKMDSLAIFNCYNLLNIFPFNILGRLQKLEELYVGRCDSLEAIFEELKISSCKVEEIVGKEEDICRIVFPQLTWLELTNLSSIRRFYPGLYILEWPKLKKLRTWGCNQVKILTSEFLSLQEIHEESQLKKSIQEPLFIIDKVLFPKVEQLALEWNWVVEEMLQGQLSKYSYNLKVLELIRANKQSAICPCCFLYTLPNLERLAVCFGFFEEIFICEGHDRKEKHVEGLSKLNNLKLVDLEDSLHLWEENSLPCKVFRNLETLEVSNCNNLKSLVPSFVSFQNLTALEVSKCSGLVNLLVVSVANSLVQLTRLKITECKMIENIIAPGRVDEMEHRILFNQLIHLELHCLPRLTSFCSGNYTVEFPFLQQVVMRQCPNMKVFSEGALSTPRLHKIQITEAENEGIWEGGLNTTIQKIFEELVGFGGMENLTLSEFPHLKEVWHSQFPISSFSSLKSLVVDIDCSNLKYIFTPSVALGLVQLQELEVKNCFILEAIIVIEGEMIDNALFPNLNRLDLKHLPKLSRFCNYAGNSIELPSLAKLWIDNCPNMEIFISGCKDADMPASKENLHTNIQPFFGEKVQLPNLKVLQLYKMEKLRKTWHHQLVSDSFCKLEFFELYKCHNVLNVFPSNMLGRLQKLEELWLNNCSSLDEIFELQASSCEKTQAITATQLRKLGLYNLPKLKHVWDMDSQGLLTCQNLLSIEVTRCDTLKSILPASVGRNLLHLEELWIENCSMVEEIFAKEEELDEAVPRFPQLTFLRLVDLSTLRSFYPGVNVLEWPMLKRLQVWNCNRVEISASKFLSFQVIDVENQHEMLMGQPPLLLDKVPLTNLESLGLDWKWFEKEALHEKLPEYSCKLKFLTVRGFHKTADICVFCFLHKLPNLEKLQVFQGFFKEVFLCEGLSCEEEHVEAPSYKLSHLRLFYLFDSLHLWEENSLSSKVFQSLEILEVIKCGNLKGLVPSSVSFQNLTTLKVLMCNKLLNLVAVPTAKSLVQLTKLIVSKCKMIEEIIIHEGDEVEDRIIFKKLSYLELQCLPSLTSFYSGNYTIEFPSLTQVSVRECPNIKIFSRGVLSAPRLCKIQTSEAEGDGFWEGNLNTTIQHMFTENGQSSKKD
ncbi:hypothetical protein ACOSQ3_030460 [Xanthoceras sorbifolium]